MPSPAETERKPSLEAEIARRRTFAIISHPDAGKTTLTEKFLLYAGAVEEAGSVRARRNARKATSDWMAMEQQRGISVTSTVMQFDAFGRRFNLLDTPGHEDFSEDTYRTLTAVDSAVMVLDAARGVQAQTQKLFDVCRQRGIPILTFVNKLDLPAQDPLALLDEIERTLGMQAVPFNWPIGDGPSFKGVYDLVNEAVLLFERTEGGKHRAPVSVGNLDDPLLGTLIGERQHAELRDQIDLVQTVIPPFDREAFLREEMSPVFFGSAQNNFGVETFLAALEELAPPPGPRESDHGLRQPTEEEFAGFIFKIQANMDPQHRDAMAFLRVCSGRFEKDMMVTHPRLKRKVRLTRPHRLFAQGRETVEEAFPGDVVGLVNPGLFAIGDTLCTGRAVEFPPLPRFQPEMFAALENADIAKAKQFTRGLKQLEEEGAVQVLWRADSGRAEPILAAVGQLQFDVVAARLEAEYGVTANVRPLPHRFARSVVGDSRQIAGTRWPRDTMRTTDRNGGTVLLFQTAGEIELCQRQNPELELDPLG